MLTAFISSVLGMIGGLLPDILKELRDGREHRREIERMEKNAELQLRMLEKQTDAKLAEIDAGAVVEEMRAFRAQIENMQKQPPPVGIKWIDGFNALIRPASAALLMLLFFGTAVAYSWGIIEQYRDGHITDLTKLATAIWGSLIGEATQAVMGYLFGYRSTRTVVSRLSSPQPAGR